MTPHASQIVSLISAVIRRGALAEMSPCLSLGMRHLGHRNKLLTSRVRAITHLIVAHPVTNYSVCYSDNIHNCRYLLLFIIHSKNQHQRIYVPCHSITTLYPTSSLQVGFNSFE